MNDHRDCALLRAVNCFCVFMQQSTTSQGPTKNTVKGMNAPRQHGVLIIDPLATLGEAARTCELAGLTVTVVKSAPAALEACAGSGFDLALIDQDIDAQTSGASIALMRSLCEQFELRSIFLATSSNPQPAVALTDCGALGYVVRPIDTAQLLQTIQVGIARALELRALRSREQQLTTALNAERDINTAIGLLMDRLHLPRAEAFEALRRYARSQRESVAKIAGDLLSAVNKSKELIHAISAAQTGKHTARTVAHTQRPK